MDSSSASDAYKSAAVGHDALLPPLSAVVIFSDIISPTNSKHSSSELRADVTIQAARTASKPKSSFAGSDALPTEILLLIFQFAFEACVDWPKTRTLSWDHATVWLEDDPLSPSLFPYSLASVCVRWFHVLSGIPAYWTRQVIIVGSHATPLTVVQTLLQWVGNLSLQLIVTRYHDLAGETYRNEHGDVRDALRLLLPHISHTWSLTFHTKYSSSIPAIWREKGDAQQLRVLTLMSDTGGVADHPRFPELRLAKRRIRDSGPLQARLLEGVTLGGHFFKDALALGRQRSHWFCSITSLTIRGYANPGGGGLSLYGFVSTVQTCTFLERMTIEDVAFVNDVHNSYRFRLEAPVVCLRMVTDAAALATLISQSLGTRLKEVVSITQCPFDNFGFRNLFLASLPSVSLILDSMDASCSAIEKLICFWNGETLSLINCPGMCDSFMRGVHTGTPPRLRRVRIMDCEHVTAESLVSWMRSREIQAEINAIIPGALDAEPCVPLIELQVHGKGPRIGREQALWLAEHLENFAWSTITPDGMQYTWDNLARELVVSSHTSEI